MLNSQVTKRRIPADAHLANGLWAYSVKAEDLIREVPCAFMPLCAGVDFTAVPVSQSHVILCWHAVSGMHRQLKASLMHVR